MKILIVDDDFFVLSGLRKLLRDYHEVHAASDGATALTIAKKTRPDVVLIDLLLAYENGLDVLEHFRQTLPDASLVMMTAFPGREIIHEAFASGADAFLGKEEIALVHVILERLAKRRCARQ